MAQSRRDFLRQSGCALGAAALISGVERFGLINALAQGTATDYKALVGIFLFGGNDGNNTVVPLETAEYAAYSAVRAPAGLALPQGQLLPITPSGINRQFGLHPSLTELQTLWQVQKLAVLCNVGPLIQPLTKAEYTSGVGRPYRLFSHSDQQVQWQTSVSTHPSRSGWGGRTADHVLADKASATLPMAISTAGDSLFTVGTDTRPLAIAPAPVALDEILTLNMAGSPPVVAARAAALKHILQVNTGSQLAQSTNRMMNSAIQVSQMINADPSLATRFPQTSLGNQLQQVAKLISLRETLGVRRQIFFCSLGGFDTHNYQRQTHANLLAQISGAMKAFYEATVELGASAQVTTFTLSDFGRTLQPAGGGIGAGTDHGWGNHQFIMGGAVRGGDFYGTAGPNETVFPTLALSGPDDTDSRGRWIPTTSVDQYAATLATWYGLPGAALSTVFPYLDRFPTANLGFLSA
ncbi:MAG: DUF1501 domain-containing protein [Pyrinomonadaceae bacterium]